MMITLMGAFISVSVIDKGEWVVGCASLYFRITHVPDWWLCRIWCGLGTLVVAPVVLSSSRAQENLLYILTLCSLQYFKAKETPQKCIQNPQDDFFFGGRGVDVEEWTFPRISSEVLPRISSEVLPLDLTSSSHGPLACFQ